jgi:hypothetical protein
VIKAYGTAHIPMKNFVTERGVDIKARECVSLKHSETNIAKANLFYTYNDRFNSRSVLHTGAIATNHAIDFHAGVGINRA